jgi:DNA-directed RNA polymerase subunit RPC12/RpoP
MATETVACPHCSRETAVTVPSQKLLEGVRKYSSGINSTKGDSDQTCRHCDGRIAVFYE